MEFNSRYTETHILQPLAYNQIRKIRRRGTPVRSIREQYDIHQLAYMFESPVLKIACPYTCDAEGYVMDCILDCECKIAPSGYCHIPELFSVLVEFYIYMLNNGYFPRDYTILKQGALYYIVDFSRFGTMDRNRIRFPKDKRIYSLQEAVESYGLRMYVHEPQHVPQKTPEIQTIDSELLAIVDALESWCKDSTHEDTPMLFEDSIYVENEDLLDSLPSLLPESLHTITTCMSSSLTLMMPGIGLDGSIYNM